MTWWWADALFKYQIARGGDNMSEDEQAQTKDDLAEEGVARKEGAAAAEPMLEDPARAGATGADVGSRRDADALSHTSVEEAAREGINAKPLDPATGVDETRDPETEESDDEDE